MNALVLAMALSVSGADAAATVDRSAPPKPAPVKPFTIAQPQDFKLKNGLRVLFLERKRAPLVDVVASINTGIGDDPKELPGLSSWTAGMLTEGAGDMDSIAFSDAENAIGAQIFSSGDVEDGIAGLHVTSAKLAEGMKLFATALLKPRFDDKEWQRVRQQTFGYFMYSSQEPQQLVTLAGALGNWGKDHRYAYDVQGTPRSLMKVTTADMKAFYAAHYRPDTVTLVVVGDVDRKTLEKLLNDNFGAWTATGPTPVPAKVAGPLSLEKRTILAVNIPGAPQTVLRVENPAPSDIKPYTPEVDVMNTLLGGSFTSRLNSNLREEHGYSYGAGSRVGILKAGNFFSVRTSVATPVTAPALKEILNELARIREPATNDEVERARNLAALSMPSAFDSGRTTAAVWANVVAENIDPKRLQKFMDEAPKVDGKALQGAAQKIVNPEKCTIVAVGDMDTVGKDLASFGPITTISVDDLLPGLKEAAAALGGGPQGE